MSKLAVYLGTLATVLIGFHLFGLVEGSGISRILNWILDPGTLFSSDFFNILTAILAAFAIGGVFAGGFFTQRTEQAALITFTSLLLLTGWDILVIFNQIRIYSADFALLLISPILFIYMITVIEWWRLFR